jgi:hypothetical protein
MMNDNIAVSATDRRPAASGARRPDLHSKAIGLVAGALLVLAGGSALAQDFDVISLKPGEVRHMAVWTANPYLRICNDMTSAGGVAVGIGRGEAQSLQPGACTTDDVVSEVALANRGAGPAMVTYRSINVDGPGAGG